MHAAKTCQNEQQNIRNGPDLLFTLLLIHGKMGLQTNPLPVVIDNPDTARFIQKFKNEGIQPSFVGTTCT